METTVVVIGGGIAGLAVAAVALNHFDRVTLVERDDLTGSRVAEETPEESKKRRSGVPQFIQPHVFAAGGVEALDSLAPGLTAELRRRGAKAFDPGRGLHIYDHGHLFKRNLDTRMTAIAASRRLINETFLDVVTAAGGGRLTVRDGTKVTGLVWRDDGSVGGVALAGGEAVAADVVLWAGGRSSALTLAKWLQERGVAVPATVKVDSKVSYAARWMRVPPDFDPEKEFYAVAVRARPASTRSGLFLAIEDGYAQLGLTGMCGERAPLDHEGWMAYAASLPDPTLHAIAARCEPAGPIHRYAPAPNVACHYHKVALPAGLLILGDAVAASNPTYGQGITLSVKSACELDCLLAGTMAGAEDAAARAAAARRIGPALQAAVHAAISGPWGICATEDARYPEAEVVGMRRPPALVYAIQQAFVAACKEDDEVYVAMARVIQCADDPSVLPLWLPRVLGLAARRWARRVLGGGSQKGGRDAPAAAVVQGAS